MWMYPGKAGAFIHRMVDRLMLGDAKAEAQISRHPRGDGAVILKSEHLAYLKGSEGPTLSD